MGPGALRWKTIIAVHVRIAGFLNIPNLIIALIMHFGISRNPEIRKHEFETKIKLTGCRISQYTEFNNCSNYAFPLYSEIRQCEKIFFLMSLGALHLKNNYTGAR